MKIRLLAAAAMILVPALAAAQDARPAPAPMPGMQMPGMSTPAPQTTPQPQGAMMCGMGSGAQGSSGGCSCCRNMAASPASTGGMSMPGMQMAQNPHAGHSMGGGAMSPSSKAYMEAHEAMMKNMTMQPTGDPDRDFVMMMVPHHQGAVDMAKVQLQYGKNPELRALAQKVIEDQEREIAQMKAWAEKNR